ncbi:MAG: serine/threonine protein kinase [Actinomycetota bacterium]|nr:serine/threonine protein kinase [Actinomycetota bacterium]
MIRFADKFVLVREIGSGGMSTVFLGRDEVLDRPVAIKLLKPGFGKTDIGARFRREGRTAARLSHPNIVQVYDAGEGEFDGRETSYIVMEYVPGGDLKAFIDGRGSLSGGDLASLSGVAAGLAHAHERGVIHRDIKPHNILLDENGRPKLADFGIARALDATYATRTGSYLGTALYSSPEQLRGEGVTPKSDIYSLGVTLYHAATGQVPFTGTPIEVASQHVSREPTPPRQLNDTVSESLEALILDCLKKDPAPRPPADEVRRGLLEAGRGAHATLAYAEPPAPKPSGSDRGPTVGTQPATAQTSPGRAVYGGRRDRWRGALAVVALAAVLALVGAIVVPLILGDQSARVPGQNAQNPDGQAQGGESRQQEGPSDQQPSQQASPEGAGQGGLTAEAAEQTVQDFYTSAVRGDIGRSYKLLTTEWRQQHFPTQADLEGTFEPVRDVTFIEGPTAEVSGNEATVTGITRAELTTQIEQNEGTWTLVNENGEWRIREWTVNPLSTQPT